MPATDPASGPASVWWPVVAFDWKSPQWKLSPASSAAMVATYRYFRPGDANEFMRRVVLTLFALGAMVTAAGAAFNLAVIQAGVITLAVAVAIMPFSPYRFRWSPIFAGMLLWLGAVLLSDAVNGLWWSESVERIARMWRLLALVLLLQAPPEIWRWRGRILGLTVAVALASVAVAWWQTHSGLDFMFPHRNMREWYLKASDTFRASGFFDHPLTFAGVMAMMGAFAVAAVLHAKHWHWAWRAALLVAGAMMLGGLFAATSRGYFVIAGGGIGFIVLTLRYRWLAIGGAILVALIFAVAGRTDVQSRFGNNFVAAEMPNGERLQQDVDVIFTLAEADRMARWYFGTQAIGDYPVCGTGYQFGRYWNAFYARSVGWEQARAHRFAGYHLHNNYLHIAMETGIIGLLAFLSMFYFIVRELISRAIAEAKRGPGRQAWAMAGLALIVVFLGGGLFEFNWDDTEVQLTMWLLLALALWPSRETASEPEVVAAARRQPWPVTRGTIAVYLLAMAFAGGAVALLFGIDTNIWVAYETRWLQAPGAAALALGALATMLWHSVVRTKAARRAPIETK